ncbi:MAG TPA: hypothetical protein EYN79_01090 [Planctomycetes bacterium]|nr:hypothetical protein [Planctomycetota bacterium]
MRSLPRTASALLLLLLAASFAGCSGEKAVKMRKSLWVTRWDYTSAEDVRTIIANAAGGGFDTVLFQVRGNATTFYPSKLEPWAEEFGHRDPGFDPLAIACEEASRHEISIHAWVNAIPGWRGDQIPSSEEQLYNSHPGWFLHDQDGARQNLKTNYYVALNPCLPEVREHIASVCAEIATHYPVDGIHLDYIRFLEPDPDHDYPYDPRTLQLYREESGLRPTDDPQMWEEWRRDQITLLVREIDELLEKESPATLLTAAVIRTPRIAHEKVRQDWVRWLRHGWIDAAFPMQYDRDDLRFSERARECVEEAAGHPVVMGIGAYLHEDPRQTARQLKEALRAGSAGVAIFAYSSFWPGGEAGAPLTDGNLRRERRESLLPLLKSTD